MADRLLGVETEYAISCVQGQEPADPRRIVERLLELARDHLTSVQDGCSIGLYLESGARLYIDTGLHIEFATPETTNPFDCVRYVEAGNRTILNTCEVVTRELQQALDDPSRVGWLLPLYATDRVFGFDTQKSIGHAHCPPCCLLAVMKFCELPDTARRMAS